MQLLAQEISKGESVSDVACLFPSFSSVEVHSKVSNLKQQGVIKKISSTGIAPSLRDGIFILQHPNLLLVSTNLKNLSGEIGVDTSSNEENSGSLDELDDEVDVDVDVDDLIEKYAKYDKSTKNKEKRNTPAISPKKTASSTQHHQTPQYSQTPYRDSSNDPCNTQPEQSYPNQPNQHSSSHSFHSPQSPQSFNAPSTKISGDDSPLPIACYAFVHNENWNLLIKESQDVSVQVHLQRDRAVVSWTIVGMCFFFLLLTFNINLL
jgi:hypothetical protein